MSKVNISTASRHKKSKFDLSSTHITTLDVGQLRPTYVTPLYAGEDISLSYGQFSRLSPLVVPTFGSFRLKSYAFFVPHRLVFKQYDAFRSGSSDATEFKKPPYIYNTQLVGSLRKHSFVFGSYGGNNGSTFINYYISYVVSLNLFRVVSRVGSGNYHTLTDAELGVSNGFSDYNSAVNALVSMPSSRLYLRTDLSVHQSPLRPDFSTFVDRYDSTQGSTTYTYNIYEPCVLSSQGRWLYNIYLSLGYSPNFGYGLNKDFSITQGEMKFNSLPLLEFCRVLFDYVYPSQWVQQQGFGSLFDNPDDLLLNDLDSLVNLLLVSYDKDFYTQLWTDFNTPAPGLRSIETTVPGAEKYDYANAQIVGSSNDFTSLYDAGSNLTKLTDAGLRMLQSISDYITRRNIGGSRFREWMRSHFGFVTKEQQSHYSTFLKSWSDEIKISDVTNTSVNDVSVLGEQAGKGIGQSQGSLKFTASEDGMLIILSMVVPIVGYYQGRKPWTIALNNPEDLYLPEFDSLGNQAVRNDELYCDFKTPFEFNSALSSGYLENGVFGFAPRYSEYKHGYDFLTGDFRLNSRNVGLDSYHTMRVIPSPSKDHPLVLDAEFLRVDNQYNRIFAQDPRDGDGTSQYDKIFTIFQFNVTAYRHMLTISESIPLFNKQGRDVTVSMNGNSI